MSKIFKAVVGVGLVVAGVVTGNFQLIGAGASLLLQPSARKQKRAASSTTVQLGEVPRTALVGEAATAGSLVDAFNYGGKQGTEWELMILALADHRCHSLTGFYVNDVYVAFAGDGDVAGYNGQLKVWFRAGTETQDLPSVVSTNGAGWTAADNGAGICYVVVAYKADKDDAKNPIWSGGRPRFLWVVKGALLYDPRKDSSVGGVGAHRWLVPSTREWSDNLAVVRYNFSRGFYACDRVTQPDQLLIGRGLSEVEAPPQNLFARANLCDELVNGEPRYRAAGVILSTEPFLDVEQDFAEACGGVVSQPQGAVEVDPGEAKAPVFSFTDRDLLVGTKVRRRWKLGEASREWINTVVVNYIEPQQKWQPQSAPVRRDVADVLADRGSREETLTLGFVRWANQAGRVGEIRRRLGRLQLRAEVTLPPHFCELEEGDWVVWQSDRWLDGQAFTFRVEGWSSEANFHHKLSLRQISASCYTDTAPLASGAVAVNQAPRPAIDAPDAGSWSLAAGFLNGGATRTPALILTGASDNLLARFVRFEFVQTVAAPDAATVWNDAGVTGPDVQRREIPVAAGATFWAGVSYVVDGIPGNRLVLGPVVTGDLISSSFAGAGALAIKNTADFVADVSGVKPEANATSGGNLIYNANAETGDTSGWSLSENSGGVALTVTTVARSGQFSFIIIKPDATSGFTGAGTSRAISVQPGQKFIVNCSVGGSTATPSGLYLRLQESSLPPLTGTVDGSNRTGLTDLIADGPVSAVYVDYTNLVYTVPANVYFVSLAVYNWSGGPANLGFEVSMLRQSDAVLGQNVLSQAGTIVNDSMALNALQQWGQVNAKPANLSLLDGSEPIMNALITPASIGFNGALAQLDPAAAAALASAGGGGMTVGLNQIITRRLTAGQSATFNAAVSTNAGGNSGNLSVAIQVSPAGTNAFANIQTSAQVAVGPGEPGSTEIGGVSYTNTSGITQSFDFRAIAVRAPVTAGGTIITNQSYLNG